MSLGSILDAIGGTPLVELKTITAGLRGAFWPS
jgi:hypothetical protein